MEEKTAVTRLQAERQKRIWTQEEVGRKVGVDPKTVGRWERGEQIAVPSMRRELSELFGADIDRSWFLRFDAVSSLCWLIPYDQNPYFTDEKQSVEDLRTRLTAEDGAGSRIAISGLGGMGKTQLALEYAYRYQNAYQAVFWINASSQEQASKDIITLARSLKLSGGAPRRNEQFQELLSQVRHWLQTHEGWLLILDNTEEESEREDLSIVSSLLTIKNGHIILTTRAQSIANLVQNILLDNMSQEEGAQFLLHRSRHLPQENAFAMAETSQREQALSLAHLLGGLPLALEQAAAYIQETGCGLADYARIYETSRKELLQTKVQYKRLYTDYSESVATTWLISFQRVEQRSALATDLLNLCAYLAPDAIPVSMITRGSENLDGQLCTLAKNPVSFDTTCQILLNYSLIKRFEEGASLSMHRLVQAVLEDSMEAGTQRFWVEQAVTVVEHAFHLASEQSHASFIPHAQTCAMAVQRYAVSSQTAVSLLEKAAGAAHYHGFYIQAEQWYTQAYDMAQNVFTPGDLTITRLSFALTNIDSAKGEPGEEAKLCLQAEAHLKTVLKPDRFLAFLNHSIWVLSAAQNAEQTDRVAREAFTLMQTIPDLDPLLRAQTYQATAACSLFRSPPEVIANYTEALRLFKEVLGPEDPEIANTLLNFGSYVCNQSIDRGERLLLQALHIFEKRLGPDHPKVTDVLIALAFVAWKQRRHQEAQEIYQRTFQIRQQKLGPHNPETLEVLRYLATLAADRGHLEEAEWLFEQAITTPPSPGEYARSEYALLLKTYTMFLRQCGRIQLAQLYERRFHTLFTEEEKH